MRSVPTKMLISLLLLICFPLWVFAGIDFDGVDDRVNCGSDASIDGFTTLSLSAWVYPDDFINVDARIASKADDSGVTGWSFRSVTDSALTLRIGWSGIDGTWEVTDGLTSGIWQHVGFTYDSGATTNDPKLYIDGISQTVTQLGGDPTGTFEADDAFDFIVAMDADSNRLFDGKISEVDYWNVVLTDDEMQQLGKSRIKRIPLQIRPGSLKLYHPFDEVADGTSADGTIFTDLSGNGNDGVAGDGINNTGLTAKAEEVLSY